MEGKGEQLFLVSHRCKEYLNEGDWDDPVMNQRDSTGKKGNYILIARVKVSDLGQGAQGWVLAKKETSKNGKEGSLCGTWKMTRDA